MSPLVLCQEVFVPELLVAVATLEQLGNWPLLELGLLTRDLGGAIQYLWLLHEVKAKNGTLVIGYCDYLGTSHKDIIVIRQ